MQNPVQLAARSDLDQTGSPTPEHRRAVKITVKTRKGLAYEIEGVPGLTLMEAIRSASCDEILALCGGSCSCGTCHIFVEAGPPELRTPASVDEEAMLESSDHRRPTSRLSCQIVLAESLNGLIVRIAPED